jgi:hypothetical protein
MNNKHSKTLDSIFFNPVKKNIKWSAVEKLVGAIGGVIKQGDGSRIRIDILDQSLNIHTPHPQKELKPYQVRALKKLFSDVGIQP